MEAIVLAGGLGTRLAGRLHGVPKSMAPVAGHPFLEIVLHQLRRAGCTRIVLAVGHLHAIIQDHFCLAFNDMRIDYSIESSALGTGGAIRQALAQATEDSVLVMNGDTYLQGDYADMMRFHSEGGAAATIAVIQRPDISRYGGVVIDQKTHCGIRRERPLWPRLYQRRCLCPAQESRMAARSQREIFHRV